jgi:hypothetical protein
MDEWEMSRAQGCGKTTSSVVPTIVIAENTTAMANKVLSFTKGVGAGHQHCDRGHVHDQNAMVQGDDDKEQENRNQQCQMSPAIFARGALAAKHNSPSRTQWQKTTRLWHGFVAIETEVSVFLE